MNMGEKLVIKESICAVAYVIPSAKFSALFPSALQTNKLIIIQSSQFLILTVFPQPSPKHSTFVPKPCNWFNRINSIIMQKNVK